MTSVFRKETMKHYLLALAVVAIIVTLITCKQFRSAKTSPTDPETVVQPEKKEEPLLLSDETPLLLDDPADHGDANMADNSRCFVCHINYAQEKIALTHALQDMGCVHCHGESDEHIADESWASGGNGTAPDKIFTKDQINPFCMDCHKKGKLSEKEHEILFIDPQSDKVCTDCHGDHLLEERKTKWK